MLELPVRRKRMKNPLLRFSIFPLILSLCLVIGCKQQEEKAAIENEAKDDLQLAKIPRVVMDGLKAKFPKAEIHMWTEENEGEIVVYDIEFKQEGWKFEADIKEDGSIHNWEKEIEIKDLPEAVSKALETKYPKSTIKEIMQITAVHDGMDALEGYEIVLKTADMKEVEITVAPDGKVLEDSGEKKPEEK
jgi:hypothetical protein